VRKAVILTMGAAGVVVLERVGSGLGGAAAPRAAVAPPPEAAAGIPVPASEAGEGPKPVIAAAPATEDPPGATRVGDLRIWEVPAEMVATVDSTGAGDAFCGALAAALAEGRSLAEAVIRAVAAGALATTRLGAREGMPTAVELEEFLGSR
jgi:ribokinase